MLLFGFSAGQEYGSAEDPHLQVLSIYGNLEESRPSSIFVVLQNNASLSEETDESGLNSEDARSIVAELLSTDDRIKILSGPQMAGSLDAGGENATLQFMALAEGVPLGIHPLQLRLNYSWLYQVIVSGEIGTPSFEFFYEKASTDIPLQVKVVRGPAIELEGQEGETLPGIESSLQLFLANRGDETAIDLQMQARPGSPFLMVENGNERISLAPGKSALLGLSVFTDENATSGYYALPCKISYRDEEHGERSSQDLTLMVFVGEEPFYSWQHLGVAGLSFLLLAGVFLGLRRLSSGRKKIRIIRS